MNLQKLNPWNWFKHEEDQSSYEKYRSNGVLTITIPKQ